MRVVDERGVGALQPACALDEDHVVGVDHHFRDGVVAEERLERAVAEHVVGDLPDDPPALVARQRGPVERELLGDCVQHPFREVLGGLTLEELGTELRDHRVVDRALHVGVGIAGARRRDRRALHRGVCNGASERDRTLCDHVRGPVSVLLRESVVKTHVYARASAANMRFFFGCS